MRDGVVDFGGEGPGILLLHGLMGRASTWWSTAQWLRRYGRVVGLDARAHGRASRDKPWRTEVFADDAAARIRELDLGPAIVIGHSMGGLHAWALAARHPELVRAVVSEDMAPDQRGKTVEVWRDWFAAWPVPFASLAAVRAFFGADRTEVGDYFIECFEETADGYRLTADLEDLYEIAGEWGEREYWSFVEAVRCPLLAIEAEHSAMPPGQIAEVARRAGDGRYFLAKGAGHVVHYETPEQYRGAVEAFVSEVLGR
ncbi:alpha/beta fold hydrolase [Crossiella sp. NPDC003009]